MTRCKFLDAELNILGAQVQISLLGASTLTNAVESVTIQ